LGQVGILARDERDREHEAQEGCEDRRHERVTPRATRAVLRLSDGNTHPVKLIDISLSGAALATEVQPPLGATVTIGQTSGTVVRHFMGGIAVEFFRPIPVEGFNEDITL